MTAGALYIVATPIGNLEDCSARAIRILKEVDLILAEDTRHSQHFLQHFGIQAKMWSCHEHNEQARCEAAVTELKAGRHLALISDAGTPGVSDPGARLVKAVLQAGLQVIPIPGASAVISAWSASGLEALPFHFYGFLPAQSGTKQALLTSWAQSMHGTLCFYESPHRIHDTLICLGEIFGWMKEMVLAKELTKAYETILKASIQEILSFLERDPKHQLGEFVLLLENPAPRPSECLEFSISVPEMLKALMKTISLKEAVKLTADVSRLPKNQIYEHALLIKNEGVK